MMSKTKAIPYSEELFRFITTGIKHVFDNCKGDIKLNLMGIWPFLYFEGSNSLKSIGPFFVSKSINLAKSDKQKLNQSIINCDYGSIGYAFKKIKENIASKNNESYHYLYKTFNDPRGVVCYLDSKIRQEHAIFFPVVDNDHNILGILDLFFYGDIKDEELKAITDILWKNFRKKWTLYRLCVNTFIIQQFSEFQITSNKNSNIDKPITRVEKLLSLICNTPLFYFTYRNNPITANYIGVNFESIQNLINHEYRFCSYVKREIKCFHKMQMINNGLSCQNNILSKFYYDILKEAKLKSCKKEYQVFDCEYIVESVQFESIELPIINNDYFRHKELTGYESLNEVAQNKFKSEILFSFIKKKLKDAIVLTLYQKIKRPYLIYVGDGCNKETDFDQLKDYISPSELMHYQYSTEEQYIPSINKEQLLRRSNLDDKESEWNVVHFEIVNKELFVNILKKKIADKPEEYARVLLPYWNIKNNLFQKSDLSNEYEDLELHYLGNDPLKLGDKNYSSIINEQISLILSEFKGKEAEKQATRAAISQVMARNMSHNIGSHVLSRLITETAVKQVFYRNKQSNNENIKNSEELEFYQCINKIKKIDYDNSTETSNEKLIADFNNYLKNRMDFLADITTNTPVIENTKGFYNDIIKPFINNRVLNDRISGISDFNYEIILCKPDVNHQKHCNGTTTLDCKTTQKFIKDSENNEDDIFVSIPNDIVGNHAFYTILENIIRNTAKHAVQTNKIVEFKIKVQEASEVFNINNAELGQDNLFEYYAVSIFDNCEIQGYSKIEWDINKKRRAGIGQKVNEIPRINELVVNQNEHLNKSILENNQLRHGAWGLIEMDASAAYLRKLPVEQIDLDDFSINEVNGFSPLTTNGKLCIFQAFAEQGKYLGYRFFMRKPREILLIEGRNELSVKLDKESLRNNGIWLKSIVEIEEAIYKNIVFPHRLIVLTPNAIDILHKIENNPLFSNRNVSTGDDFDNYIDKEALWDEFYRKKNNLDRRANLNAIHDNHGSNYCIYKFKEKKDFIEIQTSLTGHYFNDFNYFEQSWPIKIGVLDERIQSFCLEKYSISQPINGCKYGNSQKDEEKKLCYHLKGGVPFYDIFRYTNIYVPEINKCNLNLQTFDKDYENILLNLQDLTKACDFIVLHLGIIEKLIAASNRINKSNFYNKEDPQKVSEFIRKNITSNEEAKYDCIVLTSGRGKPHNLPKDIRYLNFSTISQYLTTQRNKFALTEALYSARNHC